MPTKNQLQDVFKIGGIPTHTFVPPIDYNRIILNLKTPGRALVVEGPSGIGKTTAIKKAIEELNLTSKINELKASKAGDKEIIAEIPHMKDFGIVFIDDFHRLSDNVKSEIADFIKTSADEESENTKVIIVGINEAGRSLINFAPDLVNRLDIIRFDNNPDQKIIDLIEKGEASLKIKFSCHSDIVSESNGGFYLAQMLCSELCQKAGILEECSDTTIIEISFEGAKSSIWHRLDNKFSEHAKIFALGSRYRPEGRAPYLHLLHGLATSGRWHLDIRDYARSNPEMRLSVLQVVDKGFLADLFKSNHILSSVLHFDDRAKKIVVEDPQFIFYIRNIPWNTFSNDLGFRQIGFKSKYDFALSFAGEDRTIAEAIFNYLSDREISVFYDKNEQDRIAAENVEDYLAPIYTSEAKFILCIVSNSYPNKIWTNFESKQFQSRFSSGEIIPIVLTGTTVGSFSKLQDVGYLNFDNTDIVKSVASIGEIVVNKIRELQA